MFQRLEKAHKIALEILGNCNCDDGCPKCVYDPFCGNNNQYLSRIKALELLKGVLTGRLKPRELGSFEGRARALNPKWYWETLMLTYCEGFKGQFNLNLIRLHPLNTQLFKVSCEV